jgi:hypothetical protein
MRMAAWWRRLAYIVLKIGLAGGLAACATRAPYDIDKPLVSDDRGVASFAPSSPEPDRIEHVDVFKNRNEIGLRVDYPEGTTLYIFRFGTRQEARQALQEFWAAGGDFPGDECCIDVADGLAYGYSSRPARFYWTNGRFLFALYESVSDPAESRLVVDGLSDVISVPQ